jgi:ribosomal protein L7/L12
MNPYPKRRVMMTINIFGIEVVIEAHRTNGASRRLYEDLKKMGVDILLSGSNNIKIPLIREYRKRTGSYIKEAKDQVDEWFGFGMEGIYKAARKDKSKE